MADGRGSYLKGGEGIRSHLKVGYFHLFKVVLEQRSIQHQPVYHYRVSTGDKLCSVHLCMIECMKGNLDSGYKK